ncbi:hypothetical protein AVEN_196285-1, partial [Araneus ventricosus]
MARVLMDITRHGPSPPVGGMHYQRHWASPNITVPTRGARTRLLTRRLLIYEFLVPFSGTKSDEKKVLSKTV